MRASALPWPKVSEQQKLVGAYELIHSLGGEVFTLRMGRDALICVTGSVDPARTMSRRIQRAFESFGLAVPLLAFALEVTRDDKEELHLHGALVPGDIPKKTLGHILRRAGGFIKGHRGSTQVEIKPFNMEVGGPAGWVAYPKKAAARTRRVIEHDRIIYIHRELRAHVRSAWNERKKRRDHGPLH